MTHTMPAAHQRRWNLAHSSPLRAVAHAHAARTAAAPDETTEYAGRSRSGPAAAGVRRTLRGGSVTTSVPVAPEAGLVSGAVAGLVVGRGGAEVSLLWGEAVDLVPHDSSH